MRVDGERRAPAAVTPGKRPGIQLKKGWLGTRPVWTGAENLAPIGIRSPYRPVRSELLYRLSDPGPPCLIVLHVIVYFTVRSSELNEQMNCIGE